MPREAALTKRVDELKGIEKKFSFLKYKTIFLVDLFLLNI
jgi:hypothetical protein